jgi:hypothetical protein
MVDWPERKYNSKSDSSDKKADNFLDKKHKIPSPMVCWFVGFKCSVFITNLEYDEFYLSPPLYNYSKG